MKMRTGVMVMGVWAALFSAAAPAQTLDEVLAKNYEARGGLPRITAVSSARITGTMSMGGGMEAPFVWQWKRPNKLRLEFTVQGMTGVQAYDGQTGWMIMPFMGSSEPEKMPEDQLADIREQADFEGELVNWKAKGHQVQLVGKEKVEGTDAFKLKVVKSNGDVAFVYLDAEYFLEIKGEGKRTVRGQELEFETSIGDYKEVGGLMIPHSMSSRAKGAPAGQTITFTKVELDVPLDDSLFTMPTAAKKDAPSSR